MRRFLILAVLAMAVPPTAAQELSAPDNRGFDALRLVFRNQSMPIGEIESCKGLVNGIARLTLGDWMAWVLSQLEPIKGVSGVNASCGGEPGSLRCEVHAQRAAGNEVWKWGVRFQANGVTGAIDPASLRCDMAG